MMILISSKLRNSNITFSDDKTTNDITGKNLINFI